MKNEYTNQVKLGLYISLSLLIFIAGIYFIGQRQQLFSNTFHLSAAFKNISGLQIGNNVRFSGINVGVVADIRQVTDSSVIVDMLVDEHSRMFIKRNAKAIIGSDGLMGNKIVLIIPGSSYEKVVSDYDSIETSQPVSLDDVLLNLKITSEHAADITGDMAVILKKIRNGEGTIGKLLMDSAFAGNLDKTLINIKQGAGGFKQNMDAASHNILLRGYLKRKAKNKIKRRSE